VGNSQTLKETALIESFNLKVGHVNSLRPSMQWLAGSFVSLDLAG